jgi:hypothetical protein
MVSVRVPNPGPPLLIIPLVGLKITPASALGAAIMQVERAAPAAAVENLVLRYLVWFDVGTEIG